MKFELTILGSNSATPTSNRFPSSQVLNVREKLFLIDCGEGTQIQLRRNKLKFSRINHIFISHMHGDHVLGLPGLVATFSLLGRTNDLHIFAHSDLKKMFDGLIHYFSHKLKFKLIYHAIDPSKNVCIHQDKSLEVWSVPLDHRVPTCGFFFKEKPKELNMRKNVIQEYEIPIVKIPEIKSGADFEWNGVIIPNRKLTLPAIHRRSYAYISDTTFKPDIAPMIKGVDLLYHEATFKDDEDLLASKTKHSTATQAAKIAKLADAKKLLIGHFSSRYFDVSELESAAKEVFENTVAIEDNMVFEA